MNTSPQTLRSPDKRTDNAAGNHDLSEAVRRALTPVDGHMSRYVMLMALGGSLTTLAGCGSMPLMTAADADPSMVVAMVAAPAEKRSRPPRPSLPTPVEPPELAVDRRPEPISEELEPDNLGNALPLDLESIPQPEWQPQFDRNVESEVIGLRINGLRSWQRLNILDMDVVLDDTHQRYLPLLRILNILEIEHSSDFRIATFHLPGEPEIQIDLTTQSTWLGDRKHQLALQMATSDITGQPDIYVLATDLELLLPIQLIWDDINYEFKGTTNQVFAIWEQRNNGHSLLFADANLVGMELPSLLGTAEPSHNKLSFMEWQWRSRLAAGKDTDSALTLAAAPTVWGNIFGGRYKLSLANTEVDLITGTERSRTNSFVPSRAEWTRSTPTSELTLGDSSFGLHDLAFPLASYSGIRVNGLIGRGATEAENEASSHGLHRRFYRPHVFEGFAPVGSEVRLELNGRVIATQRVLEESDPVLGVGIFRFEDITLATNSLSNIRAVITDRDGIETEIERDMVSAPQLLPAGRLSYVGGFGTGRTRQEWDTSGSLAAGRVLYGLNDRLSIGASFALQSGFYELINVIDGNDRLYPDNSQHAVAELVALPLRNLTVSGDVAMSTGSQNTNYFNYDGNAYRVRAKYFPTNSLQFGTQWFNFDPGYFDGLNRELENKTGYSVDGQWRPLARWTLRGAIGTVNQIDGHRYLGKSTSNYSQFEINTSALPRTNLTLKLDKNDLSWEKPKTLTSVRSRTRFLNGLDLRIDASFGDQLSPERNQDFFQGLNLPGFRRFGSDNRFLSLDKTLNSNHRVGIEYRDTGLVEKVSAVHAFEASSLRMSSKLGFDVLNEQPVWEGWWDYAFKERGRDRLSLITRYERGQWRLDLALNMVSLFENDNGRINRVPGDRFNPDRGGVKGRVFVDVNGNGLLDSGERGIPDIEVHGEGNIKTNTDRDGRFYLPVTATKKQMRVALNIDTIPATYSVVHGKQIAAVGPAGSTEINLAVAPMVAISGAILLQVAEPDAEAITEYRRQLAAELGVDVNADFDALLSEHDDVVVLSTARRIGAGDVGDTTPDIEPIVVARTTPEPVAKPAMETLVSEVPAAATQVTELLAETVPAPETSIAKLADLPPTMAPESEPAIAEFVDQPDPIPGFFETPTGEPQIVAVSLPEEIDSEQNFAEPDTETVAETLVADLPPTMAPESEPAIAEFVDQPEPIPGFFETPTGEPQIVAVSLPEEIDSEQNFAEPDTETVAETLVADLPPTMAPESEPAIAEFVDRPEPIPGFFETPPGEPQIVAVAPPAEIDSEQNFAEPDTETVAETLVADLPPTMAPESEPAIAEFVDRPEPIPGFFETPPGEPQIVAVAPPAEIDSEQNFAEPDTETVAETLVADLPSTMAPESEPTIAEVVYPPEPIPGWLEIPEDEQIVLDISVHLAGNAETVVTEPDTETSFVAQVADVTPITASQPEQPTANSVGEISPAELIQTAEAKTPISDSPVLTDHAGDTPTAEIVAELETARDLTTTPDTDSSATPLATVNSLTVEMPAADSESATATPVIFEVLAEVRPFPQVVEFVDESKPVPDKHENQELELVLADVSEPMDIGVESSAADFSATPQPIPDLFEIPAAVSPAEIAASTDETMVEAPAAPESGDPGEINENPDYDDLEFSVARTIDPDELTNWETELTAEQINTGTTDTQSVVMTPDASTPAVELEIIESIPLEETLLAETGPQTAEPAPQPEATDEPAEPEIIESIPLEETLLAETGPQTAEPAPQPEATDEPAEPEIIESIPLEETLLAETGPQTAEPAPQPEATDEPAEPEIIESMPPEETLLAETGPQTAEPAPQPEATDEPAEPEIIESIPPEKPMLAEAKPEAEQALSEIIESIPMEQPVVAAAEPEWVETAPVIDAVEDPSEPDILETVLTDLVIAAARPATEPVAETTLPEIAVSMPMEQPVVAAAEPVQATTEIETLDDPSEPDTLETILTAPVIAEASPATEAEAEQALPEIVESIPMEQPVVAAAEPVQATTEIETLDDSSEPDTLETILTAPVIAEASPATEPEAEQALPEIVESIPMEQPVVAAAEPVQATPEIETLDDPSEPDTLETILTAPVIAEASPATEPEAEQTLPEIVVSMPMEQPVVAESKSPDTAAQPEIIASIPLDEARNGTLNLSRTLGTDTTNGITSIEPEQAVAELQLDRSLDIPETVSASSRIARAVKMNRDTLLEMSTTLTHDIPPNGDAVEQANPPLSLAMSHEIESLAADTQPDVRLAESGVQPEGELTPATTGLKLSKKLGSDVTGPADPAPESATEPVPLKMARTLAQPPASEERKVTPIERAMARAKTDEARESGMKLSRALNLQRHKLEKKSVSGIRVVMRDKSNQIVADSVTAADGSFYLSNLLPGSYTLEVDPKTIPEGYIVLEMSKTIEIFQGEDFQEIELPPIYAVADLERAVLR